MAEWLKAHAWKACIPQGIQGSNPCLSAISASKSTKIRADRRLRGERYRECISSGCSLSEAYVLPPDAGAKEPRSRSVSETDVEDSNVGLTKDDNLIRIWIG